MNFIWILLSLFRPSAADVEAFRQSAPYYLTEETAEGHLTSARVVAWMYALDADLLLSIAHHESRYTVDLKTPEIGGKVSCGLMTPIPHKNPDVCPTSESPFIDGYIDGARHLRDWYTACGNRRRCALLGYAGGYTLIRACTLGPVFRNRTSGDDLCRTPDVFLRRVWLIRKLRTRGARGARF